MKRQHPNEIIGNLKKKPKKQITFFEAMFT
jgi:hypothetical protein